MSKKVVVGMSGGVDSSVAAYLLKEQGYEVIGVTMQIWQEEDACTIERNGGCCGMSAVEDARRVSEILDIPHYVMNFRDVFQRMVIDDFISEYRIGNTPNPCIRCNRYVKWDALLKRGMEIGADYIATGHYAKIKRLENGRYAVCKSVTEKKDQTYALYSLTQSQLSHTLMPVGNYYKEDIREIAKKLKLAVAGKPDSQEICFIPDNDYAAFLEKHYTGADSRLGEGAGKDDGKPCTSPGGMPPAGNFVDQEGNVLGRHKGIHHYTVGQRKGLGIAAGSPLYVCEIRPETDEVVLGSNEDTFTDEIICRDLNHMAVTDLADCPDLAAKIRYGGREYPCTVEYLEQGYLRCKFPGNLSHGASPGGDQGLFPDGKPRAAAPGQAIVFYQGDVVLGGGKIVRKGS